MRESQAMTDHEAKVPGKAFVSSSCSFCCLRLPSVKNKRGKSQSGFDTTAAFQIVTATLDLHSFAEYIIVIFPISLPSRQGDKRIRFSRVDSPKTRQPHFSTLDRLGAANRPLLLWPKQQSPTNRAAQLVLDFNLVLQATSHTLFSSAQPKITL
jgi:hypothetical protein